MDKSRAAELIPILEAIRDGKEVQERYRSSADMAWPKWGSFDGNLMIDFKEYEYRIKPKLREWWLCWMDTAIRTDATKFPIPDYNEASVKHWENRVKVREVLDE